jgi:hypothetical protein
MGAQEFPSGNSNIEPLLSRWGNSISQHKDTPWRTHQDHRGHSTCLRGTSDTSTLRQQDAGPQDSDFANSDPEPTAPSWTLSRLPVVFSRRK